MLYEFFKKCVFTIKNTFIKSIEAALKYNQNSAIFAPGWLVEKDRLEDSEEFWSNILRVNGSHEVLSQKTDDFDFRVENVVRQKSGERVKVCDFELKLSD